MGSQARVAKQVGTEKEEGGEGEEEEGGRGVFNGQAQVVDHQTATPAVSASPRPPSSSSHTRFVRSKNESGLRR